MFTKKSMRFFILILAINIIFISHSFCQTNISGEKYVYEFRDGTTVIATFIKKESGNIHITTEDGNDTYIPEIMVSKIISINDSQIVNGKYWFPNLHDSRYFFSPSAFGLEKGEGYYSTSYFWLWQAQLGVTDNLSVGAGTTPLGIPLMLNFKLTVNLTEKSNMAYGWLLVADRTGDFLQLNMPFAVYTYGNKENNFTIGTGLAFPNFDDAGSKLGAEDVVFNLATSQRISKRFAFVFETWIFNAFSDFNTQLLGGPGLRYFRKINRVTTTNGAGASTWDLQLLTTPELLKSSDTPIVFIPMFGRSWKF